MVVEEIFRGELAGRFSFCLSSFLDELWRGNGILIAVIGLMKSESVFVFMFPIFESLKTQNRQTRMARKGNIKICQLLTENASRSNA